MNRGGLILSNCMSIAFTGPVLAEKINCKQSYCDEKRNVPAGDSKVFKLQCDSNKPRDAVCGPHYKNADWVSCENNYEVTNNYIACKCSNKKNSQGKGAWFAIYCD